MQRNFQVDSVQIEAAIFLDAAITSTVNLTGQVGMMQVKLQLNNEIPAGGRITITFPTTIAFLSNVRLLNAPDMELITVYPKSVNGTLWGSGFADAALRDGCRVTGTTMQDVPCLVITTHVKRDAGSDLQFHVTDLRMPSVAKNESIGPVMIVSLQQDSQENFITMDQIKDLSFKAVFPNVFSRLLAQVTNDIAAEETDLTLSFTSFNIIEVEGFIVISLPLSYGLPDGVENATSQSGFVEIVRPNISDFTISVQSLSDKHTVKLVLNSGAPANTSFEIRLKKLINQQYPGDISGNYEIASFSRHSQPIDRTQLDAGVLQPNKLFNASVTFDSHNLKTGSFGNLTFRFFTEGAIQEGSVIVLQLPRGFVPCKGQGSLSDSIGTVEFEDKSVLDAPNLCKLEVETTTAMVECEFTQFCEDQVQTCMSMDERNVTIKVKVDANCTTQPNSDISLIVGPILNPVRYGRTSVFDVRLENQICGSNGICAVANSIPSVFLNYIS